MNRQRFCINFNKKSVKKITLFQAALDYGGPRKEFFRLILIAIKEKYFDNGLRDLLANDYIKVGIVFGKFLISLYSDLPIDAVEK